MTRRKELVLLSIAEESRVERLEGEKGTIKRRRKKKTRGVVPRKKNLPQEGGRYWEKGKDR